MSADRGADATAALDAAAIVEISELYALYCHIADARARHDYELVFSPDVTVDMTAFNQGIVGGTDALRRRFEAGLPSPDAHVTSDVYVYRADGETRVKAHIFFPRPEGTFYICDIDDVVERKEQGWRIVRRRYTPRGSMRAVAATLADH